MTELFPYIIQSFFALAFILILVLSYYGSTLHIHLMKNCPKVYDKYFSFEHLKSISSLMQLHERGLYYLSQDQDDEDQKAKNLKSKCRLLLMAFFYTFCAIFVLFLATILFLIQVEHVK